MDDLTHERAGTGIMITVRGISMAARISRPNDTYRVLQI
jgi:hypothetical protein